MPRAKQTAKRTRNEEVIYMEPPSDHPLFQYFSRLDDLNNYIFNFSERIVISPRYLDIQLLESQNFNQLSIILHDQGLIDFVQIKNTWYPELIRICYSTLSINFNEEHPTEFTMKFRLNKVDYELDSHRLARNEGASLSYKLCIDASLNRSFATIDDLVTMWAMVNGIKIYWPYFIAHNMLRFTKSDHSKGLGYAYLWTRIFEYLGIDVSGESGRRISQNNIIDERTIHHMGRGIEEGEEQQPPQEQVPQE
ncbi:hypothetical protein PIB30_090551 [Stylosanthes scabra]|uniref:Uncharacterized protein n=1 Tax=Stylosanthes scabra TaxID=79078 RepID=A0ABU6RU93_9FABA|nr:hypothetical protein [Stylosanthes scabra]